MKAILEKIIKEKSALWRTRNKITVQEYAEHYAEEVAEAYAEEKINNYAKYLKSHGFCPNNAFEAHVDDVLELFKVQQ